MSKPVRLVAHLSDVHILDRRGTRPAIQQLALRVLSFARALDATARIQKLRHALAAAKQSRADHVVLSGDLTEVGSRSQFEVFAEVLADAGIEPERITLVPGNHDLYTSPDGWRRALDGPLRPYAAGAAAAPGKLVDRGNVVFVPLDVTRFQSLARSGGEVSESALMALERRLERRARPDALVVVVQHHPPFAHAQRAWHWIDGLVGHAGLLALLARQPRLHLLHGHMHVALDRAVGNGPTRVFGAPAIVDDREGSPRLRLYDVVNGALIPR